jgi:hypothetical protein
MTYWSCHHRSSLLRTTEESANLIDTFSGVEARRGRLSLQASLVRGPQSGPRAPTQAFQRIEYDHDDCEFA